MAVRIRTNHRGTRRATGFRHGLLLLVLAAALAAALPAAAQTGRAQVGRSPDLAEEYQRLRFRAEAVRLLARDGHGVAPRPPARLSYAGDTLSAFLASFAPPSAAAPPPPAFVVETWQTIPKLGRGWFETAYDSTEWAYLGTHGFTMMDSTRTTELRARLQAHFGAPTVTSVERRPGSHGDAREAIQFEYWFVLNDRIPLVVMDVNGPFERGLVLATDRHYRDLLPAIRQAFLAERLMQPRRAPYVDYYYHAARGAWYRTGFDGDAFFLDRIARPRLERGRPFLGPDAR